MRALFLSCLACLAFAGCRLTDSSYTSSTPDPTGYYGSSYGTLTIDAAHQTGAMGEISAFEGSGDRLEAFKDGSTTFVQVDSIGSGWWVMSAISIDQDIDTLVPGVTYRSSSVPAVASDGSQPISMEVRGCSGPEYTNYTYDDLAQDTTVRVEQLPSGERRVHYDCRYVSDGGETQHTVGYFDYAPSGSAPATTSGDGVPVLTR